MEKKIVANKILIEEISDRKRFDTFVEPEREFFEEAASSAVKIIEKQLNTFTNGFPDTASKELVYSEIDNKGWTTGFWTGMIWMAYELTGDEKFKNVSNVHIDSFLERIVKKNGTDTHDLGFLYSLSAVAGFKVTQSKKARECGLEAAKELYSRYNEVSGGIKSHGPIDDKDEIRVIIDCMLNLPLLYWAAEETGNENYHIAAYNCAVQTNNNHVRSDGSSYQVCMINPTTGELLEQKTFQGYSDDSTWSRGQAWGIYGFTLSYSYTKHEPFIHTSKALINYYLNRLPMDDVAAWDLIFTEDDTQRDSSAASTAVCGLLELIKHLPDGDADRELYKKAAVKIMTSLVTAYTTKDAPNSNGLLKHGVYGFKGKAGVDECTLFGDYYYMEALMRLLSDWNKYW